MREYAVHLRDGATNQAVVERAEGADCRADDDGSRDGGALKVSLTLEPRQRMKCIVTALRVIVL